MVVKIKDMIKNLFGKKKSFMEEWMDAVEEYTNKVKDEMKNADRVFDDRDLGLDGYKIVRKGSVYSIFDEYDNLITEGHKIYRSGKFVYIENGTVIEKYEIEDNNELKLIASFAAGGVFYAIDAERDLVDGILKGKIQDIMRRRYRDYLDKKAREIVSDMYLRRPFNKERIGEYRIKEKPGFRAVILDKNGNVVDEGEFVYVEESAVYVIEDQRAADVRKYAYKDGKLVKMAEIEDYNLKYCGIEPYKSVLGFLCH